MCVWKTKRHVLFQRAVPHPAGDSSLPRSDPNISTPDKGECFICAHERMTLVKRAVRGDEGLAVSSPDLMLADNLSLLFV